ncbi:hypothetical protein BpHYR1_006862 [Brachionus plicatilis]|uniref:Uncharacterized protein n=1 Tax=Brachionus plicatilis TaxID=10195 RepID=A0A3M7P9D3_BRAPC|nr:hypothetical protein BpHYR1_006862 [Brachionus plicatilis]
MVGKRLPLWAFRTQTRENPLNSTKIPINQITNKKTLCYLDEKQPKWPPSDDYYYDFSHYSDYEPEYYAEAGPNAETTTQLSTTTTKTTDLIFKKIEFNLTTNKTKANLESETATLSMNSRTVIIVAQIVVAFLFVLIGVGVFLVVRQSTTIDKNQFFLSKNEINILFVKPTANVGV